MWPTSRLDCILNIPTRLSLTLKAKTNMSYIGHKISDWEKAIRRRDDIEFEEIYLEDGWVSVVIGTILQPTKHKVRGEYRKRKRRVRWNCFGVCMNANGTSNGDLYNFNISL